MRSRCAGSSGTVGEASGRPAWSRSRAQTGSSRGRHRSARGSAPGRARRWRRVVPRSRRPRRARERDLGEGPQAARRARRRPRTGASAVGDARAWVAAASSAAVAGSSGPPSARRQERRDGRVGSPASSYSHECCAAGDDEGLDRRGDRVRRPVPRGPPRRVARSGSPARRVSSSPCASRTGPVVAGDRRRRADRRHTTWPRGRR